MAVAHFRPWSSTSHREMRSPPRTKRKAHRIWHAFQQRPGGRDVDRLFHWSLGGNSKRNTRPKKTCLSTVAQRACWIRELGIQTSATATFQSGESNQLSGNPMLRIGTRGCSSSNVCTRARHWLVGANRPSECEQTVSTPKTRRLGMATGECQSGWCLGCGIVGLLPRSRFQSRPWWAHMFRTSFKDQSQVRRTSWLTPN